jgi:excisionase family DNA binding protein
MQTIQINTQERFMSINEIAAILSVSVSTVRRMVHRRNITYLRVGRLRRYNFGQIVADAIRFDTHECDRKLNGQGAARFN